MIKAISSRGKYLSPGQALLCFVLAGLLLYNPFVGLLSSSDGLSYDHLARNRATVGASELQHFSPVSNSADAQTELDVDTPATGLLHVVCEEWLHADLQEAHPPQAEFFAEFWNKPPPSL